MHTRQCMRCHLNEQWLFVEITVEGFPAMGDWSIS